MTADTITVSWDGPAGGRSLPLSPPADRAGLQTVLEAALTSGSAVRLPGREWRLQGKGRLLAWGGPDSLLAHLWCGPAEGEALVEIKVHRPPRGLPTVSVRRPGMRAVETETRRSLLLEAMAIERDLVWLWTAADVGGQRDYITSLEDPA